MSWLKRNKHEIIFILLLAVLSLPALLPLFRQGFFLTDDGEWMIIRFSAFHEALRDGQFPVRFLGRLLHGYGYPVANFLYPGFMYLAEPIYFLGFGFVDTIKIVFGISLFGSAFFCYLWLRKFFGMLASLLGALAYLYAPYHMYDAYTRGSLGELLALAVIPFVFWSIEKKNFALLTIGIAVLILSHNTVAVLTMPLIFAYMLLEFHITGKSKTDLYRYAGVLLLGAGLSAFFWFPAVFDLQYTKFSQTQVSNWQEYFSNFQLIGLPFFIVLVCVIALFITGKVRPERHRLTVVFLLFAAGSAFLAVSASSVIWSVLPVAFVQFPFRFLSILIVCTAFLSAFLLSSLQGRVQIAGSIVFIVVVFTSAMPFLTPREYFDKGDAYYATNQDSTTVKNEYLPLWVDKPPTERYVQKVTVDSGEISGVNQRSNSVEFKVMSDDVATVTVNTLYFPGWTAFIDGRPVEVIYKNETGFIQIPVPAGSHSVAVRFTETPVRLFSDIVSLISLLVIMLLGFRKVKL